MSRSSTAVGAHTLGGATSTTGVSSHGDGLRMVQNVLEELDGTLELEAVDGLRGLTGVLERHTEVGTAGASRLRRVDFGGSVSDLYGRESQRGPFFKTIPIVPVCPSARCHAVLAVSDIVLLSSSVFPFSFVRVARSLLAREKSLTWHMDNLDIAS